MPLRMRRLIVWMLLFCLLLASCTRSKPATPAPTPIPTAAVTPAAQATATPVPTQIAVAPSFTPTSAAQRQLRGQINVTYPRKLVWAFGGQLLGVITDAGLDVTRLANLTQTRVMTITAPSRLVDFSADGHTMALTTDAGQLLLQDINRGQVTHTLQPPQRFLNARFSADGRSLVMAMEDLSASLWDVASGQLLKTLSGFQTAAPVYDVFFAADGQHLIWVSRAKVQLMNVASGELGVEFRHEDFVSAVALTPDGRTLATAAAGTVNGNYVPLVKLWDVASGKELAVLTFDNAVTSIAFSPDRRILAAASGTALSLWDVASQKQLAVWQAHDDAIAHIAFSPDGATLASASADGTLKLWRTGP